MTAPALPMPIKCVAAWAGGKRRLAPRIVELLGPHDVYHEPFVGGCSILFAKPRAKREVLYDLNRQVTQVLWTLMAATDDVAAELATRRFDRAVFEAARDRIADPHHVLAIPFVADLLTVWWMGPGGLAGTSRRPWFAQRHTKTGGCPERRWRSFVESVPALGARLSGAGVYRGNGVTMLAGDRDGFDRAGTAIYCDPPYLTKSFRYVADFTTADHQTLADALNGYRHARIVVSYYDDGAGTLARLYPPARWRRIDVSMSKNMSAAGGKAGRAVEVLLVNDATEGR